MAEKRLSSFFDLIRNQIGEENIATDVKTCLNYSQDYSRHQALPVAVVFPKNHDDVALVLKLCNQFQVPVTPWGKGTGTTGGAVPLENSISLSLDRMNKILKIDAANRVMVVEAGVLNETVQQAAAHDNLFWAPDPSSSAICSVGGNLACNAAGPRAVKYGSARENTLGLRAVTGAGDSIQTGFYTTKGAVGYDLTRLLIGSEGTLAIITEATLKLLPLAECYLTFLACYSDIASATQAVTSLMSQSVMPYILEFMDAKCSEIILQQGSSELPLNTQAILLIQVESSVLFSQELIVKFKQAATNSGLILFKSAESESEVKQLWSVRKSLSYALKKISPQKISEDIVVPVTTLPEFIAETEIIANKYHIPIVNFGHAGNGNIHVNLLIDYENPHHLKNAPKCLDEIIDKVLALKGAISGEHGIGIEKQNFLPKALDPNALELMRKIKHQFDPLGILNPQKLF